MIKYAKSDISDGVNSLKIGVGNIVSCLLRKELTEYIIPFQLNYLMAVGALREMFGTASFLYSDKYINLSIDGLSVDVYFYPENTKFILKT
ncbi:hypothetical protein [Intestinibacter sp.]|uniref:hypothetical protein n=1 Tax=Intestinibacter sp. TaxID=1965304 RepID=UPI003F179269